jgi:Uma2 family endonuclease
MPDTARVITAEELEKFPQDDYRYELVRGRLIRMSPVGYQHGRVVAEFMFLLQRHLRGRSLGVVMTEVGFKLASNPDTVRAPDIAFIRQERIPSPDPRGFWAGPPDLAVEVLSPDDRASEVREKIEEYLQHGVPLALVVDADLKTVTIYRRSKSSTTLRAAEDLLDLGEVVPGFRCALREIFE